MTTTMMGGSSTQEGTNNGGFQLKETVDNFNKELFKAETELETKLFGVGGGKDATTTTTTAMKKEVDAATKTVQNFFQTTLDDANYYVEKKTKQFDISDGKSNLRRTETTTKQWLEKQKRDVEQFTDEKKKDLGMTTSSSTKSKNPVEDVLEGCTSSENFNCNNCGLFST